MTTYQTSYKTSTGSESHNESNSNCLKVYKALRNLAPSYLAKLCIPVTAVEARQRLRSWSAGNLVVLKPRSEFGKRAFALAGPHAWNNLPETIKSSKSLAVFKKQLKTHLFRQCYKLSWFFLFSFICIIVLCNCKVPLRYFKICRGVI